jgi:anti-anti-sigma regulatory factor
VAVPGLISELRLFNCDAKVSVVIQVQADKSNSILRITFSEKVTAQEAEESMTRTNALLDEMLPEFRLVADLSALKSMDVACAPFIAKVMDRCNERGVTKVIRIIPDPHKDIGLSIMSVFHYDRRVRILTFGSVEEAEEALRLDAPRPSK